MTENHEDISRPPIRINFAPQLVPLVLSGEKNLSWRINDEKGFRVGDDLILWLKGKDERDVQVEAPAAFARGIVVEVWEKPFKEFTAREKDGHEKFETDDEMIEQYKKYYGSFVSKDTIVKIIRFKLINPNLNS